MFLYFSVVVTFTTESGKPQQRDKLSIVAHVLFVDGTVGRAGGKRYMVHRRRDVRSLLQVSSDVDVKIFIVDVEVKNLL